MIKEKLVFPFELVGFEGYSRTLYHWDLNKKSLVDWIIKVAEKLVKDN